VNRVDNSAATPGPPTRAAFARDGVGARAKDVSSNTVRLRECEIIESVVVQPSKRAKEVSPVRKRWEKKKNREKSPVGAALLLVK